MQLLISVVDEKEAESAILGGADIIDVKNPKEGALGANFPRVIRAIRQIAPPHVPVSATIGDAPNKPGTVALAALGAAVCGIQYVKVGLFGVTESHQAIFLLEEVCCAVREHNNRAGIIAAAYADAGKIGALPPLKAPSVALAAKADGCMLDTAVKNGESLFTFLSDNEIRGFVRDCRKKGLLCALAGSLSENDMKRLSGIDPDIVGFRSAACLGDRVNGTIDPARTARLKTLMETSASPLSHPW